MAIYRIQAILVIGYMEGDREIHALDGCREGTPVCCGICIKFSGE